MRNEVNDARSELSLLNSSVQQLLISMKDVIEQQLPSKAPIASLTQFVSRQHYEQAIHALGSEIDRKASTDDAKNIKFQLKVIISQAIQSTKLSHSLSVVLTVHRRLIDG